MKDNNTDFEDDADKTSNKRNQRYYTNLEEIPKLEWELAKKREQVIRPLVLVEKCTTKQARAAAAELGLSTRQIYNLIQSYRASGEKFVSLLKGKSSGGKGKGRLQKKQEIIIQATIEEVFLSKQRLRASVVIEEVKRRCSYGDIKPPSENAIRTRISQLHDYDVLSKRYGTKIAKTQTSAVSGKYPEQPYPLAAVQIDHTPVDVIIVDEIYRLPIGRPYLTVAIDVYSRCIAGFCLSLEAPSATTVGLCLVHMIFPKDNWLAERKIKTTWQIWGKPNGLYVDNASEFHSIALQRGCEAHGIKLDYRPLGQPHFGGIVERVIGTMMDLIHRLPGTTFSNVKERANYPSEKKAQLTLSELESWLTIAIVDYYHQKKHRQLGCPPIIMYEKGIAEKKIKMREKHQKNLENPQAFLLDFLPVHWRLLGRDGFTLDRITYFSNNLKPLIARRKKWGKLLLRRDPRDISRIYVLHPETNEYLEIPCRALNHQIITLWEHKACLQHLKQQGESQIDEKKIFKALEEMQEVTRQAAAKSRAARRKLSRVSNAKILQPMQQASIDSLIEEENVKEREPIVITEFQEIEEW
ncbi:MAG: Mu transposase C-terminal domain-containing protein [Gammaproteobacteria bacterium]